MPAAAASTGRHLSFNRRFTRQSGLSGNEHIHRENVAQKYSHTRPDTQHVTIPTNVIHVFGQRAFQSCREGWRRHRHPRRRGSVDMRLLLHTVVDGRDHARQCCLLLGRKHGCRHRMSCRLSTIISTIDDRRSRRISWSPLCLPTYWLGSNMGPRVPGTPQRRLASWLATSTCVVGSVGGLDSRCGRRCCCSCVVVVVCFVVLPVVCCGCCFSVFCAVGLFFWGARGQGGCFFCCVVACCFLVVVCPELQRRFD